MSFRWTATAWRPGGQASGGRSARPNTQYRYSRNLMTVATRLAARSTQISVLIAANLVATVIRFLLFRYWVFGRAERPPDTGPAGRPAATVHRNELAIQGERTN